MGTITTATVVLVTRVPLDDGLGRLHAIGDTLDGRTRDFELVRHGVCLIVVDAAVAVLDRVVGLQTLEGEVWILPDADWHALRRIGMAYVT